MTGIREAERRTWEPSCCPLCGAPRHFSGEWVETTQLSDPEPEYLPGRVWCSTPRCGQVCKVCRRLVYRRGTPDGLRHPHLRRGPDP